MRKAVIFGLALIFAVSFAYAATTITKKAGDYTVTMTIDKSPPVTGKNNVDIKVADKAGKAVTDATVRIEYSMPAMPGMPPMNYKSEAGLKGESYKAVISPSMAGPWNMLVKITRGGRTDTAKFTIDVK